MEQSTKAASPKFSKLPNVPLAFAPNPPPHAMIPTLIKLIPIKVTTMPETSGVMIRRVYFKIREINISTEEATIVAPKTLAKPPVKPAEMIGPIKEKLVPCTQSKPQPMPPNRRHCTKVAIPETIKLMETRYAVVSISRPKAPAMINGGVQMATKIASKC